jgi:hypothetical protein
VVLRSGQDDVQISQHMHDPDGVRTWDLRNFLANALPLGKKIGDDIEGHSKI